MDAVLCLQIFKYAVCAGACVFMHAYGQKFVTVVCFSSIDQICVECTFYCSGAQDPPAL